MLDNQYKINDRIIKIVDFFSLKTSDFAKKLETSHPRVRNILIKKNPPSIDILQKLLEIYPEINSEWLITGKGEMFISNENNNSEIAETRADYNVETNINKRIEELLKITGLSAQEFAKKTETTKSIIYHIISGRNNPSYDYIYKIIDTFKINADWLITGKGEAFNDTKSPLTMSDYEISKIPTLKELQKKLEESEQDNKMLKQIIERLLKN